MEAPTERRQSRRHIGKKKPDYCGEKVHPSEESAKKFIGKKRARSVTSGTSRKIMAVPPSSPDISEHPNKDADKLEDHASSEAANTNTEVLLENTHSGSKSYYQRVKETLRLFNTNYLRCIQEEEERVKNEISKEGEDGLVMSPGTQKDSTKIESSEAKSSRKSKGPKKTPKAKVDKKRASKRPDLKAMTQMIENKTALYHDERIGHIPGIKVGDQFTWRAEMVVLGLHSHWLNGIDCMGDEYANLEKYKSLSYEFPLAVSIIMSGVYEDDVDNSEDIIYTGQGGNILLGNKKQFKDQELKRGNLALKNNFKCGAPVRVFRGHKCKSSFSGKIYTYNGLYKVIDCWDEKGAANFTVYKYKLIRMEGQLALTTSEVRFSQAAVPRSISHLTGLVLEDISFGRENLKIPATNLVDDSPFPPAGFKYSESIVLGQNVVQPSDVCGCSCKGACVDPRICSCARLNGNTFPYVRKNGGRLIEARQLVIECGNGCSCDHTCVNRTSEQGLRYQLEVFRTANKGWAVRSWDAIPAGAPVCEYTGILSKSDDVDGASDNNYIFNIDCLHTIKGLDGREKRSGGEELMAIFGDRKTNTDEYSIDAGTLGNVSRFINHSCQPNLFVQCILSSHRDLRMCKIMLFASDTIPPLQELCYDYGYALDSVVRSGRVVELPCYCGAIGCRKRLH